MAVLVTMGESNAIADTLKSENATKNPCPSCACACKRIAAPL